MGKRTTQDRTVHVTLIKARATTVDGERWIEGYATTPEVDRAGDVVDPMGAKYALPLPLLWMHKHDEPIGTVTEAHITSRGIRVKARIAAGLAKADEIWRLISDGVLNAVSIGFRVLESEPLKGGNGYRYRSWEWLELSVVSVPAQPGAKISVAKMMAHQLTDLDRREVGVRSVAAKEDWKSAAIKVRAKLLSQSANDLAAIPTADRKGISAAAGQAIALAMRLTDHLTSEITRLESRIAEMEMAGIKYCGTWQRAMDYQRGAVVTHKGSAWVAVTAGTMSEPGDEPDWQLMVKRGRDG